MKKGEIALYKGAVFGIMLRLKRMFDQIVVIFDNNFCFK